jgi:hypothetical protein
MPIQFIEKNRGKVVEVHVSGKVTKADFQHFVPEFERQVRQNGKLRLLFDITDFNGWEVDALWEEIKFDIKYFSEIELLAIVGDKKWHHGMAVFCKPFTKATIQYFDHTNIVEARNWLGEAIMD